MTVGSLRPLCATTAQNAMSDVCETAAISGKIQ